ncbi:cytochrome P450 [Hypoxylon sp. NC0597]|nr:cytochrome P450 [Hypoxylon sp. NC0597]
MAELIPALQKQWRTVSFSTVAADAGSLVGMSKEAIKIMHQDLTSEYGFSGTVKIGLWGWWRQPMVTSTTEAIWGPQNPYRDPAVAEAWKGLVRKRYGHHRHNFGLSLEDAARGKVGYAFAVLENSTSCTPNEKEDGIVNCVDLDSIRTSCPTLLSIVNPRPRVRLEDGDDAYEFDHTPFARKHGPGQKKPNRVAFRAFGGGHIVHPGRHFASTEIMALAALLILQFEIVRVAGKWVKPTWENSPVQAGFAVPDKDIEVEFRLSDGGRKWRVTFSGSDSGGRGGESQPPLKPNLVP